MNEIIEKTQITFSNGRTIEVKGHNSIFYLLSGNTKSDTKTKAVLEAYDRYLRYEKITETYDDETLTNLLFLDIDKFGLVTTMNKSLKAKMMYLGAVDGINLDPSYEAYKFTSNTIKEN